MFYLDIFKAFYRKEIQYLIVGGVAVNLHGVPRVTNDLDVIISHQQENVKKIKEIMHELGYQPRLPGVKAEDLSDEVKLAEWIKNRNLKVFSYFHPAAAYLSFDILLVHPLKFDEAFSKKIVTSAEDISVNLVSLEDLITMKEFSGRKQDKSDIDHLKKLNGNGEG